MPSAKLARAIAALGSDLRPDVFAACEQLYAPHHVPAIPRGISVVRDAVYGGGERNRLDVFAPARAAARPVLLFVHGGGFVTGDKRLPGSPYYDNVGIWAALNGFIGVTMTYGLAPAARYPSGALDIASAVAWLQTHISAYGGDPHTIVVMGQSAGAIHAATYAARPDLWPGARIGVAGMILLSGVYAFDPEGQPPNVLAYFGDPATAAAASPLAGLVAAGIPLLVAVAEWDPPLFHAQTMTLARTLHTRDGRMPHVAYLAGHNHLTEILHLNATGTDDSVLAAHIIEFFRHITISARSAPLAVSLAP
jgi:triacylglycerol lipase